MITVEKYGVFELLVDGTEVTASFAHDDVAGLIVSGFGVGTGKSAVRFMPTQEGIWHYRAGDISGEFLCIANVGNNHGPVVADGMHFRYADGTDYFPVGTTLYAWVHQSPELIEQTLATLNRAAFNKVRMCVFPKKFDFNFNEPVFYPFESGEDGRWDASKPNYPFWENLDTQIKALCDLGIEADLILFHPYDSWGFSDMSREESLIYIDYCVKRYSAYRNVWWSLANEYDLVSTKPIEDWYTFGEKIAADDICKHLISVHNWTTVFPKTSWLTHCSLQGDVGRVAMLRKEYELPVIMDEFGYEGNIPFGWGNLTAFEEINRAWRSVAFGGYATHGETYYNDEEVLWWAKGGRIYGESAERFAFLKAVLYEIGALDLVTVESDMAILQNQGPPNPVHKHIAAVTARDTTGTMGRLFANSVGGNKNYRLIYLGRSCPCYQDIVLPENGSYNIEAIDIWEMTRTNINENVNGRIRLRLPGKEGIAVLIKRISGDSLN